MARKIEISKQQTVKIAKGVSEKKEHLTQQQSFELLKEFLQYNNKSLKAFYTMNELSEITGIGYDFIRKRIASGIIEATYFGNRPMVHLSEVLTIIRREKLL